MSYILIDRQSMSITHKHPDRAVLGALSWIECTNAGAIVSLSSIRPLSKFTDLELLTIYKNGTGEVLKSYGIFLAQAVFDMARRLPDTKCLLNEAIQQAACISDGDHSKYSYLPGSLTPLLHESVFDAPSLIAPKNVEEVQRANSRAPVVNLPITTPVRVLNPGAIATMALQPSERPTPHREVRSGTMREIAVAVTCEMWELWDFPSDDETLAELHGAIMAELQLVQTQEQEREQFITNNAT